MSPAILLFDCPKKTCRAPLSIRAIPREWEHGVFVEHEEFCQCGEKLTVTLRVTREEKTADG